MNKRSRSKQFLNQTPFPELYSIANPEMAKQYRRYRLPGVTPAQSLFSKWAATRELGMNPAKLGKIDNHKQEKWKLPLPEFIEEIYLKRFGKTVPDSVISIEDRHRLQQQKKEIRRIAKQQGQGNDEGIDAVLVTGNMEK